MCEQSVRMDAKVDLAVIVSSCDAFQDCWIPLEESFSLYWPDCCFPIYLITNKKTYEGYFMTSLKVGVDRGWASNMITALSRICEEYVLYLQEDYWLSRPFHSEAICRELNYMKSRNLDYLRLTSPYFDHFGRECSHAFSPVEVPYGVCLQGAIWKKTTFLKVLVPGWSGWDFENRVAGFCSEQDIQIRSEVMLSNATFLQYVEGTAVRKGRWTRAGSAFLKRIGHGELIKMRITEGRIRSFLNRHRQGRMNLICSTFLRLMDRYNMNV